MRRLGFGLALILWAPAAAAADTEVTSDTAAQFYDVRSPTGEVVLSRRRLTTTLGVGAYDLLGSYDKGAPRDTPHRGVLPPDLQFKARLRYDADYGAAAGEAEPNDVAALVPGFSRGPVDLMYGYLEGRRLLGGWFGFRLGRQYVTDALGWWSFDGAALRLTTPFYVAFEPYAGFEVRGGMPLSTSRWERGGVWRGSRDRYDPSLYPSFQPATVAPAYGVAIESTGVTWLHGRLSYRKVQNTGRVTGVPFATSAPVTYEGARVSQERIGYSIDAQVGSVGGARAGIAYDLHLAKVASMYASADAFVHRRATISIDYDFFQPTFDGDSIWNFFRGEPMNDVGLRTNVDATDRLAVSAAARVRAFGQDTAPARAAGGPLPPSAAGPPYYPSNGVAFNSGGDLAARYRLGVASVSVRAAGNFGDGGQRVGGDLTGERWFDARWRLEGRASVWQWRDKLRPDRDAASIGYVAGLGYAFAERSQALLEWQHDVNRLVGHRFRLVLWLSVAVAR